MESTVTPRLSAAESGPSSPCPYSSECLEGLRLLKKSLSARSAVQRRPETRPRHYESSVFSPRNRGQKRARRSFATRCHLPGTSVNRGSKCGGIESSTYWEEKRSVASRCHGARLALDPRRVRGRTSSIFPPLTRVPSVRCNRHVPSSKSYRTSPRSGKWTVSRAIRVPKMR